MSLFRSLAVAGMFLLFGAAAPVHAALINNALSANALTANALTANAVTSNALVVTESAIADLNGVVVEEISLPRTTQP